MTVRIHTDGGARGNPGPAGIGILIEDARTGSRYLYGEYIGTATNNQAEYRALLCALEKSLSLGATDAHCFLDSELVVKQLKRVYRVRDAGLAPLFLKVWNAAQKFKAISFSHVPRSRNREADALVNQALDSRSVIEKKETN